MRAPESRKDNDDIEEKPGTYIPSPVPTRSTKTKITAPNVSVETTTQVETAPPVPSPVVEAAPAPAPVTASASATEPAPEERPAVSEQVKMLILGGTDEDIEEARRQIHPKDPRQNMIEISLAPAYFYDGSQSNYSFHRYSMHGTAFGLGMNLWLTPFFGMHTDYFSSVASSIRGSSATVLSADVQELNLGFRFRKHFGFHRKAPYLMWGLDYHDSGTKISKEATGTMGRKSSGVGIALEGVVPVSNHYAHTFDLDVRPRLNHAEQSTAIDARSGTKNQTDSLSLSLGGMWTLDRQNQVYWKTQYSVEQSLYQGDATTMDPHNDVTPSGVNVTDSMVIFYFGFKWGT